MCVVGWVGGGVGGCECVGGCACGVSVRARRLVRGRECVGGAGCGGDECGSKFCGVCSTQ